MTPVLLLLASLALVVACGLFVAAEFSLVTVDRPSVERAAKKLTSALSPCTVAWPALAMACTRRPSENQIRQVAQ